MQISDVVMVYFVIGAIMVGGGAISFADSGVATFFVSTGENGGFEAATNALSNIDDVGTAITAVVSLAVGAIVLVWNLIIGLVGFIHWPIIALNQNNAPPMAVLMLGGGFTAAFYMAIIGLLWRAT